jgi:hypothetical protein
MSEQASDRRGAAERYVESSAVGRDVAAVSLSNAGKAFAFFGGSIGLGLVSIYLAIRISRRFSKRGEKRKARDVWKWFGLGFLSMIVSLLLIGAWAQTHGIPL